MAERRGLDPRWAFTPSCFRGRRICQFCHLSDSRNRGKSPASGSLGGLPDFNAPPCRLYLHREIFAHLLCLRPHLIVKVDDALADGLQPGLHQRVVRSLGVDDCEVDVFDDFLNSVVLRGLLIHGEVPLFRLQSYSITVRGACQ